MVQRTEEEGKTVAPGLHRILTALVTNAKVWKIDLSGNPLCDASIQQKQSIVYLVN